MAKIRILDSDTISQIAAGEVIERPASVVKELVENSLDAGAARIQVEIRRGGLEEIRVLDDGEGMDRSDLELSLRRHATSKIVNLEDLRLLSTLGFRGEALASVTSVSRWSLESAPDESGEGTRIHGEGGGSDVPESVGHPRGTTVAVRDLFFNTPARRKFLRSEGAESDQILEVLQKTALAHFDRRFTLRLEDREVLDVLPAANRSERVSQIFGRSVADSLIRFEAESGAYRVSGFASRPEFTRSTGRDQRLFVNGRPFRDRGILHAIVAAYVTLLPRGRFPFVVLFLEVPSDRVDFNVHPSKAEVRFADTRPLYDLVRRTIRGALEKERPVGTVPGFAVPGGEIEASPAPMRPPPSSPDAAPVWTFSAGSPSSGSLFGAPSASGLGALVPLGQYRDSYILASDEEGLLIIDQHVAHERVLYERLLEGAEREKPSAQSLLIPETLELDAARSRSLEEGSEILRELGFRLEEFGQRTWLIREVPAVLGSGTAVPLLRDLADEVEKSSRGGTWASLRHRLAATTACHAAIKVNFPLTPDKMAYLLDQLVQTASPMTCPHGRPVVLRLAHHDLEKSFGRR